MSINQLLLVSGIAAALASPVDQLDLSRWLAATCGLISLGMNPVDVCGYPDESSPNKNTSTFFWKSAQVILIKSHLQNWIKPGLY